jgi:hypothetical protein
MDIAGRAAQSGSRIIICRSLEDCPVPTDYHAEHVGSLLRPPWLLETRSGHTQGRLSAEQLRKLEDRAALEAIEPQIAERPWYSA